MAPSCISLIQQCWPSDLVQLAAEWSVSAVWRNQARRYPGAFLHLRRHRHADGRRIAPRRVAVALALCRAHLFVMCGTGLSSSKCYRFQWAYYAKGAKEWSSLSQRLYINDCAAYRSKLCRERGCKNGGTALGPQMT